MSSKVSRNKGPALPNAPVTSEPEAAAESAAAKATDSASSHAGSEDGFTRAAQGLLAHRSSPLMSGAMRILAGDGVMFPAGLTDPKSPANDAKYLRLLAAVVGLDELERYFKTREEKEQLEYIKRKEKRRQERLAQKQRGESSEEDLEEENLLDA